MSVRSRQSSPYSDMNPDIRFGQRGGAMNEEVLAEIAAAVRGVAKGLEYVALAILGLGAIIAFAMGSIFP